MTVEKRFRAAVFWNCLLHWEAWSSESRLIDNTAQPGIDLVYRGDHMNRLRDMINCRRISAIVFATLSVAAIAAAAAYQEEGPTRHLWDTAFVDQPKNVKSPRRAPVKRIYFNATPQVSVAGVTPDTVIGVTIWRLRSARSTDRGERIITHEGPESVEWLPERVSPSTRLAEGDRVRIAIEAARTGYLYVIDREEYADGSLGEPVLIFPTTRTRGGDNQVGVGRLIEIPGQDDKPSYFTLRVSRPDHVGENLTVIVSPAPIDGLQLSDRQQKLSVGQVAEWEKKWGGQDGRLEMENGEGKQWTSAEKIAAIDRTRGLKQTDPVPQTIYYRPGGSSERAVLLKLQLKYGAARRARRR